MTFGPLEFLVLTFPGERPDSDAIGALAGVRRSGDVRLVDSLVVARGGDGSMAATELADIPELSGVLTGTDPTTLIDAGDAEEVGEMLEPGTCALLLLVEHAWAREAAEAVREAGGRIAASVRIPPEFAEEALSSMEASS